MEKKQKFYNAEVVWYSILGFVWVLGLVCSVLGVCAYNIGKLSSNTIYILEQNLAQFFNLSSGILDLRFVGTIMMFVAMVGFLIVIFYFSSKASNEIAAEKRRQERLRILMENDEE